MLIDIEQKIVDDIYAVHQARRENEKPRNYLGGSAIGRPCERSLWYSFRHAMENEFDGRMLRLFETGHLEEPRMIEELREAGYEVVPFDADGNQFRVEAFGGHFAGHLDGLIRGVPSAPKKWHVIDYKTINTKGFKAVAKSGVRKERAEYYAQAQVYMGLAPTHWDAWGLDGDPPTEAIYLFRCKDDERLYAERIHFDEEFFMELGAKAKRIIESEGPPDRMKEDPSYYYCLHFCDYSSICHDAEVPRVDCRTCVSSTPMLDGTWKCERLDCVLPDFVGCPSHLFIPPLLEKRFGDVVDHGDTYIEYLDGAGVRIRNSEVGSESSWSLRKMENNQWPVIGEVAR